MAAQHHHRAARLDVLGIAAVVVGHGVIVPDHVAVQVGRQRVDGIDGDPRLIDPGVEDHVLAQVSTGGRWLHHVKLGNCVVAGKLPVVNATGAETVPLSRTFRMR